MKTVLEGVGARSGTPAVRLRRFRLLNRIYAFLLGYFWKPCPVCGRMFGGHEAGAVLVDKVWDNGTTSGRLMCWRHPRDITLPEAARADCAKWIAS